MAKSDELISLPQSLINASPVAVTAASCSTQCETIGCEAACESSGCEDCEFYCETSAESGCSTMCEDTGCESFCEFRCEDSCETSCQDCMGYSCQDSCETICERDCQDQCEYCEDCMSYCERYDECEYSCMGGCQSGGCQSGCQSLCERSSQVTYYYIHIDFDANGGSGAPLSIDQSSTNSGVSVTLPSTKPTRTGYRFLYWTSGSAHFNPGQTYTFTGGTSTWYYTLTTAWGPAVDRWSWSASNGSATAAETQQFYNVLRGTALPENGFSYKVWNDLVNKAAEVIAALELEWYEYEGRSAANCRVGVGATFSASKYNCVRANLGAIISTGITDRSAGDEITGYLVTRLADVINEIIDTKL